MTWTDFLHETGFQEVLRENINLKASGSFLKETSKWKHEKNRRRYIEHSINFRY